jgi:hypothetical protein
MWWLIFSCLAGAQDCLLCRVILQALSSFQADFAFTACGLWQAEHNQGQMATDVLD